MLLSPHPTILYNVCLIRTSSILVVVSSGLFSWRQRQHLRQLHITSLTDVVDRPIFSDRPADAAEEQNATTSKQGERGGAINC